MQTIKVTKSNGQINPFTWETTVKDYKQNKYVMDSFKSPDHRKRVLEQIEGDFEKGKGDSPVQMSKTTYSYVLTFDEQGNETVNKSSSELKVRKDGSYSYDQVDSNNSDQKAISDE